MELDSTAYACSGIRVAVVAVGRMPASTMRDYIDVVAREAQVELCRLRPFYTEHQKSPFTQLEWDSGRLQFRFMVGGAARSPWEDFQAHRKVHAVIGLCHLPLVDGVGAAEEQFATICRAYPSARVTKCFAFQASCVTALDDLPTKKLVLASVETIERHMQELAASILMEFEKHVLLADHSGVPLVTPLDSQAPLTSEEAGKTKKKWLGRVQKTIGDYCLLAGSLPDANAHYTTAVELSKLTGDVLWQAGAAEGAISALLVGRDGIRDQFLDDEVKSRYSDVILLYKRANALIFELEAGIKLARYLCGKWAVREVVDLLNSAIDSGKNLADSNDRLVLCVEISRVFSALGYQRKAAFYSRKVAHAYLQQDDQMAASSALQVLRLVSRVYCRQFSRPSLDDNDVEVLFRGQWDSLQVDVLGSMLSAAVRSGDALSAWNAAGQLLRRHYPLITPVLQLSLAKSMLAAVARLPAGTRCSDPALPFVRLHSLPPALPEIDIVEPKPGKEEWWKQSVPSGPFIYSPLAGKRRSSCDIGKLTWVVGEAIQVMVEVANPCAFQVQVESICLSVELVDFEAFPFSFDLPPNSCEVFPLTGVPRSAGQARLRGCFVAFSGVTSEHLFEEASRKDISDPFRSCGVPTSRPTKLPSITVMSQLPFLNAFITGGEGAVVLYEGEMRIVTLGLCNVGSMPVSEVIVSVVGKLKDQVATVDDRRLREVLPLDPGKTVHVPLELKVGPAEPTQKQGITLQIVIHYAAAGSSSEDKSLTPGRRMTIPLQLHVSKGLCLLQARLLSMEVPVQISRFSRGSNASSDPYKGSWNLQLLELELLNTTDVLFEVTVSVNGDGSDHSIMAGQFCAATRIDRDHSARVLVPLEKWQLSKIPVLPKKLSAAVNEISSRVCVRWSSGRNNTGVLQLKEAISDALKQSALEVLLPDPLTFAFRLTKDNTSHLMTNEMSPIEMLVRNNTEEDMRVILSISCRDVTGASCLGDRGILLWAGALDGVEVEVPPMGEITHSFMLCFLVPGEYTLFGAAVVCGGQPRCHCGPPFAVKVAGLG